MAKKTVQRKASDKATGAKTVKKTLSKPVKGTAQATVTAKKSTKKRATFTLQAPDANQVFVAGSFNDWSPTASPLEKDSEGTWTCAVLLEPGGYEYRFIVDDVWWDDPLNQMRRWTEFGCEKCILIV